MVGWPGWPALAAEPNLGFGLGGPSGRGHGWPAPRVDSFGESPGIEAA
jgi:hypothetical protein